MTWQLALAILGLALVLGGGIALGYRMAWADAEGSARGKMRAWLASKDERIDELEDELRAASDLNLEYADAHARDRETIDGLRAEQASLRARIAEMESRPTFPHPDDEPETVDYVEMPGPMRSGD